MQPFEDTASNVWLAQGQENKDGMCMKCGSHIGRLKYRCLAEGVTGGRVESQYRP